MLEISLLEMFLIVYGRAHPYEEVAYEVYAMEDV